MNLNELEPGEAAFIVRLDGDPATMQRLASFGMVPDVELRLIRRAPSGDPIEIELLGYRLSLRSAEAAKILVEQR